MIAFRLGKPLVSNSFIQWLGEEKYQKLVNFCLIYIAKLELPKKRGTFVEFRNGMINVSPIGRNASTEERKEFEAYVYALLLGQVHPRNQLANNVGRYDTIHNIRRDLVDALKKEFPDYGLRYVE